MYIPKDIQAKLKFEAAFARRTHNESWARLFEQCAYLLRQKDREIAALNRALETDVNKALQDILEMGRNERVG